MINQSSCIYHFRLPTHQSLRSKALKKNLCKIFKLVFDNFCSYGIFDIFIRNQQSTRGGKLNERSLNFHGAVKSIDNQMQRLWLLAKQLERETIFIFTTDNGGGLSGGWMKVCNRVQLYPDN